MKPGEVQFKAGQVWKTRHRGNVKIDQVLDESSPYPAVVGHRSFDHKGRYWTDQHESIWDLVELVQDVQ